MNIRNDRRMIYPLLQKHFPTLGEKATSDEIHGFLDAVTGLETPLDEPNAIAFDRWRQALATQGYPVWGISKEKADAIKVRAEELKTEEAKRLKDLPDLMAKLRQDAPLVTAAQLMKQAGVKP